MEEWLSSSLEIFAFSSSTDIPSETYFLVTLISARSSLFLRELITFFFFGEIMVFLFSI